MAKIGLSEGFSLIPKGIHVFKIVEVNYKEDFGKMEVVMQVATGQKHTERFSLLNKNGEPNEGALNAFSYFAKTALNNFSLQEIDEQDLVGCYIRCEVDHEEVESNKTPGKMLTFVRLGDKEAADSFDAPVTASEPAGNKDTTHTAKASHKPTESVTESNKKIAPFDLNSILG